jgi:opacity protein-like surface antigen
MKILRLFVPAACCLLLVSSTLAQDLTKTGTTAAQFLKIGVGPRAIGMGGAFTATADDITAIYWNPGGLATLNSNEAGFNHINWFADIKFDFAGVAIQIPGFGMLGTFVSVLSMDEMKVRTVEMPEGTGELFTASAMGIGVSYARNLTDDFSIGFNAKYIREQIWNESATGIGVDVGTMYKLHILNEVRLASSISNFGTKMKLQGRDHVLITQTGPAGGNLINTDIQLDEYDLPLIFRVGIAADIVKTGGSRLTTAIDAVHPNDNTEAVNSGFEYAWNEMLFLRAGVKSLFERDTEQGFTIGVGVNYRIIDAVKVKVDYAYQDFGRLANVHYLSFGVRF